MVPETDKGQLVWRAPLVSLRNIFFLLVFWGIAFGVFRQFILDPEMLATAWPMMAAFFFGPVILTYIFRNLGHAIYSNGIQIRASVGIEETGQAVGTKAFTKKTIFVPWEKISSVELLDIDYHEFLGNIIKNLYGISIVIECKDKSKYLAGIGNSKSFEKGMISSGHSSLLKKTKVDWRKKQEEMYSRLGTVEIEKKRL